MVVFLSVCAQYIVRQAFFNLLNDFNGLFLFSLCLSGKLIYVGHLSITFYIKKLVEVT